MPIKRSGRRVLASGPQSPKQPSTRHHGLGRDVKGKGCDHRLKAHQERVVLQAVFLHRARSRTRSADRGPRACVPYTCRLPASTEDDGYRRMSPPR